MTTLPPGVTLRQIDGGPTYFADHGFTYAVNMGWDNPNFFSLGIWAGTLSSSADAARWVDLGLNTAFGLGPKPIQSSTYTLMQNNGISYISLSEDIGATGISNTAPFWVGNFATDETNTFAEAVAPITTTPDAAQAGRPWYENNGWNNLTPLSNGYGGLSPYELNVALKTTVNTPNGTPRHIDISSSDLYWFAGAHANVGWVMDGGAQIAMGGTIYYQQHRNMTQDEAARGSNYGDQVDMMRIAQSTGFPAPVTAFVENGGPYTENSTAVTYITPPELNWAVWSSLIHGAQQIIYFNHSFGGPGFSFDNIGSSYYDVSQPGQTISIYDQMNATNALIAQMAPVLNSPYALNYVSVNGPHWSFETLSQPIGGLEVMARNYNDDFYIFADTRESETHHNIPATFTINDPNAVSVDVVNENRSIPVVNGQFSDTFANAWTVHIYQVNDGPGTPPPPGAPSAPVISAFSPDTAPVGDGHTTATLLTLTGIGVAGTTINVVDGSWAGTTTVDSTGHWSLTTDTLAVGAHSFSATDSNANGTSPPSATLAVTVDPSTSPPPLTNLVVNGGFETGNFTGWTPSGNVAPLSYGPQLFIYGDAHSGQFAAGFGSVGSDGTITQNLTTLVGQSYLLDFWLANVSGGPNDFTAKISGVTELHLVDAAAQPYTHYNYTFTATSTSTPLEFDFRQDPAHWLLDDVSLVPVAPTAPPPPVISKFSPDTAPVGDGHTTATLLTLTGIGVAGTTINVVDGSWAGTTTVDSTGHWSLTTDTLAVGAHSFSATDSNANGTSPPSATLAVTVDPSTSPPPLTNLVVNGGFETGNFTGWTPSGNVAPLSYGPQLFIYGDAHSGQFAAGFGSVGSDGTITQNLTTLVGQSYLLDFWLANVSGGPNDFTAKISGVTELHLVDAAAQPYTHYNYTFTATSTSTPLEFDFRQDPAHWLLDDVSLVPVAPTAPPPPVISKFSPDTAPVGDGHTTATLLTLTGIGVAGTTINVVDGSWAGTTTVDSTGHWTLTTDTLAVGAHSFSATDSNANGTSPPSATLAVTVDPSTSPPPLTNLVVNGGFETGNFTGWTPSGNVAPLSYGPQLFIYGDAHSGQFAAGFGSVGSDGTITQNLTTLVGQSYLLDFWLANASGGPNDFTAKISGVTELHLVDAAAQPYTHYNYTFTATSTSTPLEFDFRQDPAHWLLDDVSVTAVAPSSLFT